MNAIFLYQYVTELLQWESVLIWFTVSADKLLWKIHEMNLWGGDNYRSLFLKVDDLRLANIRLISLGSRF